MTFEEYTRHIDWPLTLPGRVDADISSPPAGSASLVGERGQEVPAPSRGAIDTAGNSVQRAR